MDVLQIPESFVVGHLNWGLFTLRDVVMKNCGVSPFGNETVRYRGSADDVAQNAGVQCFKVDSKRLPVLPQMLIITVASPSQYKVLTALAMRPCSLKAMTACANACMDLVMMIVWCRPLSIPASTATGGDAYYPPLFEAMLNWMEKGSKPTPAGIAERCRQLRVAQPSDCRFLSEFMPKPLATRVLPR